MGFFLSAVTTRFESLRYQVILSWQQTYAIFVFDARPLAGDKSVKGFLLQKKEVIF